MPGELIFLVEEAPEGGYTARALGEPIFTEADSWDELKTRVQDAVRCHFGETGRPGILRLHLVRDEILKAVAEHLAIDRQEVADSLFGK
jgi:hypothetical protein